MAVLKYKSSDGTWKTIATKGGNGVTDETDPVFSASPAASITEEKKAEWDRKYTKPSGGIPASDLASDVFLQGEKGDKGDKGDQGPQGPEGPKGDKGDKGDTGATGANGTNGKDGADGEDGATFTPSVDANGNLSWTNNKGLSNPPTVNIKGPKGDSGEGEGGNGAYPIVSISDKAISSNGLNPNTYYKVQNNFALDISVVFNEPTNNDIVNEYIFQFEVEGLVSITLPDTIKWANETIPSFTDGYSYIISIVDNLAVFAAFKTNEGGLGGGA